jgi:hypothetical protein
MIFINFIETEQKCKHHPFHISMSYNSSILPAESFYMEQLSSFHCKIVKLHVMKDVLKVRKFHQLRKC